ncbi:MAG: DegT/DnrJ/EryC1/StrS family aminotransferase [Candidatus Rokuibacteriota bacterium]
MTTIRMAYLDRMYDEIRDSVEPKAIEFLGSSKYILAEYVQGFERAIAARYTFPHVAGVASGTDALMIALRACGVGPGDGVIVPAFTIFVDGAVVRMLGAVPQFVDVSEDDFNLDPRMLDAVITPLTKAIVVVHLFGQCADMRPIVDVARRRGLPIIEDACQAIGARYHEAYAGNLGEVGCFSFYPTKNLGGAGDGGLLATRSAALFDELKLLHLHGIGSEPYVQDIWAYNSRLDAFQAFWLQAKLPFLDRWEARRREIATYYRENVGSARIRLPRELEGRHHVWHQFTVRVEDREDFRRFLSRVGIDHTVFYPRILPHQPAYRDLESQQLHRSWPVAESLARTVVSIPVSPQLTDAEVELVVVSLNAY